MTPARARLEVTPARAEDAPAVVALLDGAAAWQRAHGIAQWTPGGFGDEVRRAIEERYLFVARDGDAVVGCFMLAAEEPPACAAWLDEHDPSRVAGAHLARMAVARERAGEGLGLELIDAARAIAASMGRGAVRLECPADDPRLQAYYRAAGFVHRATLEKRGPRGEDWTVVLFERPAAAEAGHS